MRFSRTLTEMLLDLISILNRLDIFSNPDLLLQKDNKSKEKIIYIFKYLNKLNSNRMIPMKFNLQGLGA